MYVTLSFNMHLFSIQISKTKAFGCLFKVQIDGNLTKENGIWNFGIRIWFWI